MSKRSIRNAKFRQRFKAGRLGYRPPRSPGRSNQVGTAYKPPKPVPKSHRIHYAAPSSLTTICNLSTEFRINTSESPDAANCVNCRILIDQGH